MNPRIGLVAIGRNEGERLRRCLESVVKQGAPAVYVDSDSTDDSVATAESLGVDVVQLDLSIPFSAARARNEGFQRLIELHPDLEFVMFVDGDCEVVSDWLDRAVSEFDAQPDVAVVCGRNRERFPERSIYNWMCDMEWNTPVGESVQCGGNAAMRTGLFQEVEGFNPSLKVGEEPELCSRFRAKGWKILRVDAEMTLHDAAMTEFKHWWKRQIRTGYGGIDVEERFGLPRYRWINVSARRWGLHLPLGVLLASTIVSLLFGWQLALTVFLLGAAVFPLQAVRLGLRASKQGHPLPPALQFGGLTVLGKFGQVYGQFQYRQDKWNNRQVRLIEYKAPDKASKTSADNEQTIHTAP